MSPDIEESNWRSSGYRETVTPPAGDEQLQRARLSVTLASITATAPLLVFNLALVERKWKVLLTADLSSLNSRSNGGKKSCSCVSSQPPSCCS